MRVWFAVLLLPCPILTPGRITVSNREMAGYHDDDDDEHFVYAIAAH
jgi:hypothetical protein